MIEPMPKKLIIISNRLPLKIVEENNNFKVIPSQGGVATGLDSLETKMQKHWVGWPGMYLESGKDKDAIDRQLKQHKFTPVYLTPEQIANYYEGYSNSVLWPLCHYFLNYIHYSTEYWEAYKEVNALFCEEAMKIIEPGDIVWVQDYQLMLVPGMIRERVSDISIGYFHHIPFPSYELFRTLPERSEILEGLLGADLVAFHTHTYMRHFISGIYRVLKLECQLDEIQLDRRVVHVDAFPMGINYEKYHNALKDKQIHDKAKELRTSFGQGKLMVSVDRLDYSKGILVRLAGFEDFLKDYPEYKGKISLVMIVSPSRDQVDMYAELKNEIDQMVGNINGAYSTIDWTPVYYFYRSFDFEELAAIYHIADIALVTPLRDGMNLVAKEYVATKNDTPEVLILSEMAGAAVELSDAIIVNPSDMKEIGQAILTALKMSKKEQLKALTSMQKVISKQTVEQWVRDFVEELKEVRKQNVGLEHKIVEKKNFKIIRKQYKKARKRLILLDYDGTLVRFYRRPSDASPSKELLDLLAKLNEDPKNRVIISSGRDRNTLDKWLGKLSIGMAAEHGAFYKEGGNWHRNAPKIKWDKEILNIMKQATARTPLSNIEIKDTALVWHYRDVDVWLAELRVNQLVDALMNPVSRHHLQIMKGNKIVEVKSPDFNKGSEARRLMGEDDYDFIMAIGDDTTDEEMFMALPETAITIKVGKSSKAAKYNLPTQDLTLHFLDKLSD